MSQLDFTNNKGTLKTNNISLRLFIDIRICEIKFLKRTMRSVVAIISRYSSSGFTQNIPVGNELTEMSKCTHQCERKSWLMVKIGVVVRLTKSLAFKFDGSVELSIMSDSSTDLRHLQNMIIFLVVKHTFLYHIDHPSDHEILPCEQYYSGSFSFDNMLINILSENVKTMKKLITERSVH